MHGMCMVRAKYMHNMTAMHGICTVLTHLRKAAEVAQCPRVARRRRDQEVEGGGGKVGLALLTGQRACHT